LAGGLDGVELRRVEHAAVLKNGSRFISSSASARWHRAAALGLELQQLALDQPLQHLAPGDVSSQTSAARARAVLAALARVRDSNSARAMSSGPTVAITESGGWRPGRGLFLAGGAADAAAGERERRAHASAKATAFAELRAGN
jgi:hypothetical protein